MSTTLVLANLASSAAMLLVTAWACLRQVHQRRNR